MNTASLLNRPMLESDLLAITKQPKAIEIKKLVREYRSEALPVMNGSFTYSNLLEGPGQILTCHPYRLWEYASLFESLGDDSKERKFMDVGGAGSPLPYLLGEQGYSGLAVDLQPFLVDLNNHVAAVRRLKIKAQVGDITRDFADRADEFDVVTMVSVLEHIPGEARPAIFQSVHRLLKPGGLFYLTFDYGTYVAKTTYRRHEDTVEDASRSIDDLEPLCKMMTDAGFRFRGNDPRTLPAEVKGLQSAPRYLDIMRRFSLNIGAVDGDTPLREIAKYLVKRALRYTGNKSPRYAKHNFFRMYLEKI